LLRKRERTAAAKRGPFPCRPHQFRQLHMIAVGGVVYEGPRSTRSRRGRCAIVIISGIAAGARWPPCAEDPFPNPVSHRLISISWQRMNSSNRHRSGKTNPGAAKRFSVHVVQQTRSLPRRPFVLFISASSPDSRDQPAHIAGPWISLRFNANFRLNHAQAFPPRKGKGQRLFSAEGRACPLPGRPWSTSAIGFAVRRS